VGELCEIFQWKHDSELRPGLPGWSESEKEHLGEELSDVLLYLIRLADRCQIGADAKAIDPDGNLTRYVPILLDLASAATKKIQKNGSKYPSDKAKGSREKYTNLVNKDV
jgi:dCTP diphosphatase